MFFEYSIKIMMTWFFIKHYKFKFRGLFDVQINRYAKQTID